jgi:hypothetical protein
MHGLASKSTTTWFLAGRDTVAEFYLCHFQTVNLLQITYTTSGTSNNALTWFINTVYIMQASGTSADYRTFADTSSSLIELQAVTTPTRNV